MRVLINNGSGNIDYTRYVEDGTLSIEDSINVPTLTSFVLTPSDSFFTVPKRSSYVTIMSDIYAPTGGYGSGKILATGFVTSEPERTFLGLNERLSKFKYQQYSYGINVTSDEWLLNSKTVPYIPAFVNQTDSQILAAIANTLMPGFFDTTSAMASGTLIPYYQYDPAQTWSDIAKLFADQNRYHYFVSNRVITYQPFNDKKLGIIYDDNTMRDRDKYPSALLTKVLTVPPVNDCIVLGDVEPQMNCEDYFIGDGFTSNFQLRHQVFQGSTADLLQDDWTEAQFAQGTWIEQDPLNVISLVGTDGNAIGALNVTQLGASGTYTPQNQATFVQAQNGLELGGGINIQSGQVTFNDVCNGLIGSIFSSANFTPGNCLAGFGITGVAGVPVVPSASGASGIGIQPIYNGQYVGPQIITQQNHQYVLQMWIGVQTKSRYTRPFTNLTQTATYGNQDLTGTGTITFLVTDIDLGQYAIEQNNPLFGLFPAAPPPLVTKYMVKDVVLPPFVLYCLLNSINLNVSINYTDISLPPQGFLTVQSLTGASGGNLPWHPEELTDAITYQLGFAQQNQTAQIGQQGESNVLSFYPDDIPSVGARIRFQSWSAGQSVARVRDNVAIASEAAISGDDGVRSAIMNNISPLPRTSDECEAAAAAVILDREYPQFQGSYTVETDPYKFENLFSPSLYDYPRSGRFLYIRSPLRGVSGQNYFVNTITIHVGDLREENLSIDVNYGPDTYLERLLPSFLEREQNILTPKQTVQPPNPIFISEVLNAYLPTLDNAKMTLLSNSLTGNFIQIDLGQIPTSGCEVRRVDNGWGISNQGRIGLFTTQVFTLPRTQRDQTWYLRQVNGKKFSRFSKKIRVVYPLIPSPPSFDPNVDLSNQNLTLHLSGDVRDIYGVELRLPGVSGAYVLEFPAAPPPVAPGGPSYPAQNVQWFNRVDRPLGSSIFNVQANIAQNINSSGAVSLRPTVILNGWGPNAHVGAYELGQDQGFNWGFNNDTTDPYLNPNLAFDNNETTKASIVYQGTHQYAGCVWTFGATPPGNNNYVLNILSEVPANGEDGLTITQRSAGIWYSINGGVSWQQIYNQAHRTKRWDSIVVPVGQDLSQLRVMAFTDSHDNMAHYVFEINVAAIPYFQFGVGDVVRVTNNTDRSFTGVRVLTNVSTSQAPGVTPAQFEETLQWFDFGQPFPIQTGTQFGTGTVGSIVVQSRDLWAFLSTAYIRNGIATIGTAQPHGLSPGDIVGVGAGFTAIPAGKTNVDDAAFYTGTWPILAVPDVNTFQYAIPGHEDWTMVAITGVVARIQQAQFSVPSSTGATINLSTNGTLVQRPVFAPSDLSFDLTQPDVANVLEIASAINTSGAQIAAYFFNLTWDYSEPTLLFDVGVPVISGLLIDAPSQQAKWTVTAGRPTGYRVEVRDPQSGQIVNKFTTDHPHNIQALTQFQMSVPDANNPRVISVTPFNALGDGNTQTVSNQQSLLFNPNVVSGSNLYPGNNMLFNFQSNFRNSTIITSMGAELLVSPWPRFRIVMCVGGASPAGPMVVGNMVIFKCKRGNFNVQSTTPVTFNGVSNPSIGVPVTVPPTAGSIYAEIVTDVINLQLDWDHDYYFCIYGANVASNSLFAFFNCSNSVLPSRIFLNSDHTADTTIPTPGSAGWSGGIGLLVSRIIAA